MPPKRRIKELTFQRPDTLPRGLTAISAHMEAHGTSGRQERRGPQGSPQQAARPHYSRVWISTPRTQCAQVGCPRLHPCLAEERPVLLWRDLSHSPSFPFPPEPAQDPPGLAGAPM